MFPNLFPKRIYQTAAPDPFQKVFVAHCPYCADGAAWGYQIGDTPATVGYCDNCGATVDTEGKDESDEP